MTVGEVVKKLGLAVVAGQGGLDREATAGMAMDLLSNAMGQAIAGAVWVTQQVHQNIVAVASLEDLAAIVIAGGARPDPDTVQKADDEAIPLLTTPLSTFEVAGRLYQLGLRG
ncbi:MAG: DRTGG domain-containing protein [Negativicutes bacterium]|nr:DRTGG domain-containing protein [Negativicutes bacterium]